MATGGGSSGTVRRKWSIRAAGRNHSGSGGGGIGSRGGSALLGHLDDDDLDDILDEELDFHHQHDTTLVSLSMSDSDTFQKKPHLYVWR